MIDIMTMEQAEAEIYHFRKIFQMIRLFHLNPETQKKEVCKVGISGSENLRNIKKNCDDCIVQETFDTKEEKGKIEIFEGKLYQLITRYMEIEGEPYVMELVRGLDSDWKIGQIDHEKVVNLFMNYNDKLYKDAITDTYNRRYYEDEIKEKKDNAGVALIDLDDFKLYNDTYGHNAGDVALCTVADVIEGSIRRSDRLIRFGGDEFLLVMPGIEEDAFIKKLQMIQQKVNKTIIPGYSKIQLTISVGGVLNNGGTIETAVKHADHLMYQAKEKKNMVVTEYDDTASEVQKQQILVVDDSELNRGILIEMLKEEFDIIEAENGKEAVDKIRKYGKKLWKRYL